MTKRFLCLMMITILGVAMTGCSQTDHIISNNVNESAVSSLGLDATSDKNEENDNDDEKTKKVNDLNVFHNNKAMYGEHELWVDNIFSIEKEIGSKFDTSFLVVLNVSELSNEECQDFLDEINSTYGLVLPYIFLFSNKIDEIDIEFQNAKLTKLADNSGNAIVLEFEADRTVESLNGEEAVFILGLLSDMAKTDENSHQDYEVDFVVDVSNGNANQADISNYAEAKARTSVTSWQVKYFVDEFEKDTDEAYIQNTNYYIGTFSNSATSGDELAVAFIIQEGSVAIKLLEYGSHVVQNAYSKDRQNYKVSLLDTKEEKHSGITGFINPKGDRVRFSEKDSQFIINALKEPGEVSILLVADDYSTAKYLFTVDTEGFAELYDETFH